MDRGCVGERGADDLDHRHGCLQTALHPSLCKRLNIIIEASFIVLLINKAWSQILKYKDDLSTRQQRRSASLLSTLPGPKGQWIFPSPSFFLSVSSSEFTRKLYNLFRAAERGLHPLNQGLTPPAVSQQQYKHIPSNISPFGINKKETFLTLTW